MPSVHSTGRKSSLSSFLHPYQRESRQLNDAYALLQQFNTLGVMVTWSFQNNDWEFWERPIRVNPRSGKGSPMSARSFRDAPDLVPPSCPHADSGSTAMTLFLQQVLGNRRCDFFRCTSHRCRFVVIVPPLNLPVYLTTPEAIQDFRREQEADGLLSDTEEERGQISPPCNRASTSGQSSATPTSSPSRPPFTIPSSSSAPVVPQINPNPRRRWDDDILPPVLPGQIRPIFNRRLANARKTNDGLTMNTVYNDRRIGLYQNQPERHPASSVDIPHPLLEVYDSRVYPGCSDRAFSNQPFFDTAIGNVVRELNSPLGVPPGDFQILIHHFATCPCCVCTFSIDGYNRHIQGGICSSHPDGHPVNVREQSEDEIPRPKGRTFPNGYHPPPTGETLDTPIGIAYLEWNSRFGVPLDCGPILLTPLISTQCLAFVPT
ncbi:hypothetical protein B0H11DRAFT_1904007 [Mycena galericulata]|nr:hypothetical protein B0H11DRAFT_1904007 [Mycena galericulata]